jgi:hypothetical protein
MRWRTVLTVLHAMIATIALGCATLPADPPLYIEAEPDLVLDAAVEVLSRDGYVLADVDRNINLITGEQQRTITRPTDGLVQGTRLSTQIVVEAEPSGAGTQVVATFSITSRRPTGEYRNWVDESPLGQRLRQRFYAELTAELGLDASARSSAH